MMKHYKINQFHIRLILVQSAVVLTVLLIFSMIVTVKFSIDAKQAAYEEIDYQGEVLKRQIALNLGLVESAMAQLGYTFEHQKLTPEAWDQQVQYILKQTPMITQIYLMDKKGMQYYKSSFPETLGNRSDRDYFQKAIVGKANYSDVIESRSTKQPIVVYAIPIYKGGTIIGVMGASINLDFLSDLVWHENSEPSADASYGFIVDSKGHVIAHPKDDYVKASLDLTSLEPVKAVIKGGEGAGAYRFDGQNKLVAYDYMTETNWGILVQIPKHIAYKHLTDFQILVGITFGVIAGLSFLMVFWVTSYLKQPISEVVRLIQTFQTQRTLPRQCSLREDEFGLIQNAFVDMAMTVLNDQQALEERVAERTQELTVAMELLLETQGELEVSNHELQMTLTELNLTQEQLIQNEKMAALGRMTNNFAHEVNTPLGTALTVIDLNERSLLELQDSILDKTISSEALTELVIDVQDMTRLIRKQLITVNGLVETMVKTDFVNAYIDESKELGLKRYLELQFLDLQGLVTGTRHRLEFELAINDAIDLNYKEKLTQILKILIRNSIQHGFEDLDSGVIRILLEETPTGLKLNYEDNGKNIPEEEMRKIFEPYYKGKMSGIGKGLGLTIVYTLVVHFLNGTITCHNISPSGLAYVIDLPNYSK